MTDPHPIIHVIEKTWENGILISKDTDFFLESTFGITTASEFEATWSQDDFSDQEMVLEMLIYPDQDMRLAIEHVLPVKGISLEETRHISGILFETFPAIRVVNPGWEKEIQLSFTRDQIRFFVFRLFLDRSLDIRICQALERCRPKHESVAAKVLLRCQRFTMNSSVHQILLRLIEGVSQHHPPFLALFKLVVDTVFQGPASPDAPAQLIEKAKQLKKQLEAIQQFEKKRDRYNMEYLMMQRYPVPPDSFENTFEQFRHLSLIINDILELEIPFGPLPPTVQELGRFDPRTDIKRVFKLLS